MSKRDIYDLAARTPLEAAAPDMLAALKAIVDQPIVDQLEPNISVNISTKLWTQIIKAILKAEGKVI